MPRPVVAVLLVLALGWLGFRAVQAFDQDRHAAEAAAVLTAPNRVSHQLRPVPPGQPPPPPADGGVPEREGSPKPGEVLGAVHSPGGRFSYRPGTWLSVIDLRGLEPVAGNERYLVFLRNWAGWTLAGAARPGPDGVAQVRSAAEPRPPTIYEVIVTRAVDDATSIPHGQPVLQWFDASLGPPKARKFDFARGA
ncbi:MAG TPA: hypothetical protein VJB61_05975 [Actinomycetota bacterium]